METSPSWEANSSLGSRKGGKCREGGKNETLWEKFIWLVKLSPHSFTGWGESVSTICVGKNARNYIQYFLTLVLFAFCTCCILRCLVCIHVSCLVCIVVVSYVYFCQLMCIVVLCMYCCIIYVLLFFTLDAELPARCQYSKGPATGHLDTGFSWLPCVYKQMLRWFPRF